MSDCNFPTAININHTADIATEENAKCAEFGSLENEFSALKLQTLKTKRDSFDVNSDEEVEKTKALAGTETSHTRSDKYSVEGSPFFTDRFPEKKKIDLNPTPYKLFQISETSPVCDRDSYQPSTITQQQKVLIINASSNCAGASSVSHQENAQRTSLLCNSGGNEDLSSKGTKRSGSMGCLRRPELSNRLIWIPDSCVHPATLTDLLRVHDYSYIKHLEFLANKSDHRMQNDSNPGYPPFYPQSSLELVDNDTPISSDILAAAKHFCGAAIHAVDLLMQKFVHASNDNHQRAFVVGRPPGHHAGPFGCVPPPVHWMRPEMTSSGFCLLNTVAVAAAYARQHYGRMALSNLAMSKYKVSPPPGGRTLLRPPRIAIVDFDIHHGNGTEEIVRNLSPRHVFLPLPSSWAPVRKECYFPWLNEQDKDEVLFASIHLFAESSFYPCSGEERDSASRLDEPDANIINIGLTPVGDRPWDPKVRAKLMHSQREESCKIAAQEFRSKVSALLLPRLKSFRPDLIFISAGFDAHVDDMYHFLTEADIHWVTQQLCEVLDAKDSIGVVSVLEGGYSLAAPKQSTKDKKLSNQLATASVASTRGGGRGSNTVPAVATAASEVVDPTRKYAQLPGDGGLVKSVLAHTAALAGLDAWVT
eukprot:gene26878-35572_t